MTEKEMNLLKDMSKAMSEKTSRLIDREVSMRSMMMSCIIYGEQYGFYDESTDEFGRYGIEYKDEFGKEYVLKVFAEQKAEFKRGILKRNVHTDCEGVSYNSFTYRDEFGKEDTIAKCKELVKANGIDDGNSKVLHLADGYRFGNHDLISAYVGKDNVLSVLGAKRESENGFDEMEWLNVTEIGGGGVHCGYLLDVIEKTIEK